MENIQGKKIYKENTKTLVRDDLSSNSHRVVVYILIIIIFIVMFV